MIAALAVVLVHASALTMNEAQPRASALAVVDGRIAYVGDDVAAARRAAGDKADVIDLGGRAVIPGFDEAHAHFGLSITLGGVNGVEIPELPKKQWRAALSQASRARPGDDWIFVKTYALPEGIARARDLDFLARPVFVFTKHGGLMSTRALRQCHFSDEEIPHGFIRGRELPAAFDRVMHQLPRQFLVDQARAFSAELSRLGITSVQLITDDVPDVFETLRKEGSLTARVRLVPIGYQFGDHYAHSDWRAEAPEWVRVEGVKYFHDDSARISRLELESIFINAARSKHSVVLHVMSQAALANLLDGLERLAKKDETGLRHFRVDHVDEVTPELSKRLSHLGMIVCSTPAMRPEWHNERAFPLQTLVAAGARLCLGTDFVGRRTPPRPLDPFATLQIATQGPEAITVAQALAAYTIGSAAAEGMDAQKGSLAVGKLADLVVLSADPTKAELDKIDVMLTMVGGRVVYRRGGFGEPAPTSIGAAPPAPPQKKKKR
jgi:predicted amidohydrolase YtcJ